MSKTHYDTLQIPSSASPQDIKSAYRRLCFTYHPDRCTSSFKPRYEERLKKINQAYSVLSDPTLKAAYDEKLSAQLHKPHVFESHTVYNTTAKTKKRKVYKSGLHMFVCDIYDTIKYEENQKKKILLIIGLLFVLAQPLYGIGMMVYSYFHTKETVLDVTRQLINEKLDHQFKAQFNHISKPGE